MKKFVYIVLVLAGIIGLAGLREYLGGKAEKQDAEDSPYAFGLEENHPLVRRFLSEYGDSEVLLACSDDINADGTDDLVVIMTGEDTNLTVTMISEGSSYYFTEPVPAPRENQKIRFTNIDKGDDLEVLITGEKNGQVGYAVYKLMNRKFKDLYGENMKDCC